MADSKKAYASAGVDIERAESALAAVKPALAKATRPEVLGGIGAFGGLFDISKLKMDSPVLVSSTDGVGTKLKVAFMTGMHEGIGHDIVNHCLGDIAVMGAEPLFFLDYLGTGRIEPAVYAQILKGIAKACSAANVALLGGETAEMPGFYSEGEYDLVGTIVGVVERGRILTGKTIKPGDRVIGLPSNGLHTNGYSLARKVIFEDLGLSPDAPLPGGRTTVGKALLKPHTNYSGVLLGLLKRFNTAKRLNQRKGNAIHGAAHITGGGLIDNLPRVLPDNCDALLDSSTWKVPPIFKFLAEKGEVPADELHQVFNMGIGMAIVASPETTPDILSECAKHGHKAVDIGEVAKGSGAVKIS